MDWQFYGRSMQMRTALTVLTFLLLDSAVLAQRVNRTSPGSTPYFTGALPEAPVGHRQPRADQVPDERRLGDPNDAIDREEAAVDRKIKGICRGC